MLCILWLFFYRAILDKNSLNSTIINKGIGMKETKRAKTTVLEDILNLLYKLLAVCALFILLFAFVFGIHRTTQPGMTPAVKDGDLVVYYRLDKNYKPDDVLLLRYEGKVQVQRVIAVAGDAVDITEEGVLVNGRIPYTIEDKITETTKRFEDGVDFPLVVPEGEVFVLGDSREHTTDSRIYGTVKVKDTLGKLMILLRRRNI